MGQRRNHKNQKILRKEIKKKYQHLWDVAEVVLRGKCITINAYVKNNSQISNPTLPLKGLEKEEETKFKDSRKEEIRDQRRDR